MKLIKMLLTPSLVAISIVLGAASTAFATNWYVSSDGSWDPDGLGKTKTTVAAAITAASAGDTVYLQDGTEVKETSSTAVGYIKSRIHCDKAITISSYSGDADESKEHGVYVKGKWSNPDATTVADALGGSAVRGLSSNGNAKFVGFICSGGCSYGGDNGTTSSYSHGGGGAMVTDEKVTTGGAVFENCIFRDNIAGYGGAVFARGSTYSTMPLFKNCVITNNTSAYCGGGAAGYARFENCLVAYNKTSSNKKHGGGIYGRSSGNRAIVIGGEVASNETSSGYQSQGGGVYWAKCTNVTIRDNLARGSGGGAAESTLVDCRVFANRANGSSDSSGGHGGGLYSCTATNSVIRFNRLTSSKNGDGGGACSCKLVGCDISCNTSNYHVAGVSLGAAHFCVNCTITNNCGTSCCGGVYGEGVLYNCLIAGNQGPTTASYVDFAAGASGIHSGVTDGKPIRLVNCTVAGNKGVKGGQSKAPCGGVYNAVLVNTVVSGNTSEGHTTQCATIRAATNSCATVLTDTAKYPGCITTDPKFIGTGDHPYALSAKSPCRDMGFYDKDDPAWAWVTDPDDPRSVDLAGKPRLAGKGLDMGCYEYVLPGFLLLVR